MQDVVCKDVSADEILTAVTNLRRWAPSIDPFVSWLSGLPGETYADMEKTFDLMDAMGRANPRTQHYGIFLYTPFPSPLLDELPPEFTPPASLEEWGRIEVFHFLPPWHTPEYVEKLRSISAVTRWAFYPRSRIDEHGRRVQDRLRRDVRGGPAALASPGLRLPGGAASRERGGAAPPRVPVRGEEPAAVSGRGAAAPLPGASPWTDGAWAWPRTPDRRLLVLGVLVQLALALLAFDHAHDMRIFQATGYLVATGHSPYAPLDLTGRVPRRGVPGAFRDRLPAAVAVAARRHLPGDLRARARSPPVRGRDPAAGDRGQRRARLPRRRGAPEPRRRALRRAPRLAGAPLQPLPALRRRRLGPDRRRGRASLPGGPPAGGLRPARPLRRDAGAGRLRQADGRADAARRAPLRRRGFPAPRGAVRGRLRRRRLRLLRPALPRPRVGRLSGPRGERAALHDRSDVRHGGRAPLDRHARPGRPLVASGPALGARAPRRRVRRPRQVTRARRPSCRRRGADARVLPLPHLAGRTERGRRAGAGARAGRARPARPAALHRTVDRPPRVHRRRRLAGATAVAVAPRSRGRGAGVRRRSRRRHDGPESGPGHRVAGRRLVDRRRLPAQAGSRGGGSGAAEAAAKSSSAGAGLPETRRAGAGSAGAGSAGPADPAREALP